MIATMRGDAAFGLIAMLPFGRTRKQPRHAHSTRLSLVQFSVGRSGIYRTRTSDLVPNRRDPTTCRVSLTIKVGAIALFVSVRIPTGDLLAPRVDVPVRLFISYSRQSTSGREDGQFTRARVLRGQAPGQAIPCLRRRSPASPRRTKPRVAADCGAGTERRRGHPRGAL